VLLRLVKVGEHAGTPVTREFVPRDELRSVTVPSAPAEAAIRALEEAGIVYGGAGQDENALALMHDALITLWPRLSELVDVAAPTLRWKVNNFNGSYEAWLASGGASGRLRGTELEKAEKNASAAAPAFSDGELRYLENQRRAARREARLRAGRRIAAPVGLVLLVAAIVVLVTAITRRSDSTIRAEVQAAGNLETAARGLEVSNPALAQALLLEAYRQRPNDENGRNALAEAVSVAPGLVRSGLAGSVIMPDLSEVITPAELGSTCASVASPQNGAPPAQRYCGGGGGSLGQFATSPGSRFVAEAWRTGHRLHLAEWRASTMRPVWTSALTSGVEAHISSDSPIAVAVADDGTVAVVNAGELFVLAGLAHQRLSVPAGLGDLNGARLQISAAGTSLLVVTTSNSRSSSPLPTHTALALSRHGTRFGLGARWAVTSFAMPVLTPDGRAALQTDQHGLARVDLHVGTRSAVPSVPVSEASNASSLAVSPSGRLVAIGQSVDGIVIEADLKTTAQRAISIASSDASSEQVAVDDRGDLLLGGFTSWDYYSAGASNAVVQQFPAPGTLLGESPLLVGPRDKFAAVAASAPGSLNLTALEVLDLRTGVVKGRLTAPNIQPIGWGPSGDVIVVQSEQQTSSVNRHVKVGYGNALFRQVSRAIKVVRTSGTLGLDPNGLISVRPRQSGVLGIYDVRTGHLWRTIRVGQTPVQAVAFSASGNALAIVSGHRLAVISGLLGVTPHVAYGPTVPDAASSVSPVVSPVPRVVLSPDGRVVASSFSAGSITVTEPGSGVQVTIPVPASDEINGMAVSDSRLAVLGSSGDVTIFGLDGSEWLRIAPPMSSVSALAAPRFESVGLSGAGSRLVTTSSGSVSRISLLTLDPLTWASSLCEGHPALSATQFAQYAAAGAEKPLCP
jgi:hypothetical protein